MEIKSLNLLGSVACTPPNAMAGQSVLVEVLAPDGTPYNNTETTPICINGVAGSKQYLVWNSPGQKTLIVTARRHGGPLEKLKATVMIAPAQTMAPTIKVHWRLDQPTRAVFSIVHAPEFKPAFTRQGTERIRIRPEVPALTPVVRPGRNPALAAGGVAQPIYSWELSHGRKSSSSRPQLAEDFGPHLDPNRPYSVFHVSVTIQSPGEAPVVIHRSVSLVNPYHLMKRRGVLQPLTLSADYRPTFVAGLWHARFILYNPEPVDVKLTSRRIELVYDPIRDVHKREYEMLAAEPVSITLKAKSATSVDVFVPAAKLPQHAVGFAALFTGQGPNKLPVRVTAHFDVPEHVRPIFQIQLSPAAKAAIAQIVKRGLVADPKTIHMRDIADIIRQKLLPLGSTQAVFGFKPPVQALDAHTSPPEAKEGETCDPWNLPNVVPEGLACLPTAETGHVKVAARFMNAKKGDIVLSPGNGSIISQLLARVEPPQFYSHSGMMTRNRDEITHSTAAMDRMTAGHYLLGLGGSGGIRPDILKYGWPGVITQSVQNAVEPYEQSNQAIMDAQFHDPETGDTYMIVDFSTLQAPSDVLDPHAKMIPAMVVKPDPLNETDAVRSQLHGFADFALTLVGKSHYRFYCYTDPTIFRDPAPAEAKWAANSRPTVCSSMIWNSIRQSGVEIEGGAGSR